VFSTHQENAVDGIDARMDTRHQLCLARLFVGFALNAVLWFVFRQLAMSGGIERDFRLYLLGGSLAAATLVIVVPVFWRGTPWQVLLALVLLAQPAAVLVMVLIFAVSQRY
jgi:hypothetical protein